MFIFYGNKYLYYIGLQEGITKLGEKSFNSITNLISTDLLEKFKLEVSQTIGIPIDFIQVYSNENP